MTVAQLMDFDLHSQAELVRRRQASAVELVTAAIGRLEAGAELNVLVDEQFESAIARAREIDAAGVPGPVSAAGDLARGAPRRWRPPTGQGPPSEWRPLAGVPFLLKDLGDPQAGRPERMGSVALRKHVADHTAATVGRYEAAGLIICGRTNTPEFGNHCATEPVLFGPTLNPWDQAVSPGGSSGGSAAAVAARMVAGASGGDATGSIRMPASCCGVVGLKPRRGRVSMSPGSVALDGLAVKHALTRTVRDTALLLDITAGELPGDAYTAPAPAWTFAAYTASENAPRGVRVALAAAPPFPGEVDPRVRRVAEQAVTTLGELGHRVADPVTAPVDAEPLRRAISIIHAADNAATVRWLTELLGRPPHEDELDPVTWEMAREGEALSAVDHLEGVDAMHAQSRRAAALFDAVDVIVCPTLNTVGIAPGSLSAPRGSVDAFFDVEFAATGWTALVNATGWAAISLPLGEAGTAVGGADALGEARDAATPPGLPVGVQLIARSEPVLLGLAAQLELALPWDARRPAG